MATRVTGSKIRGVTPWIEYTTSTDGEDIILSISAIGLDVVGGSTTIGARLIKNGNITSTGPTGGSNILYTIPSKQLSISSNKDNLYKKTGPWTIKWNRMSSEYNVTSSMRLTLEEVNATSGNAVSNVYGASFTIPIPVRPSYTVSFNANGGSGAPSAQTKWYGDTLTLSATVPSRTGYTFKGWATSASGSAAYQPGGSYTSNAGITLYAVWEPYKYTVSYNANGGDGAPSAQTKVYGQTLTLSSTVPTRVGYNFKGWATSATSTTATYKAGSSYTANAGATLYAVWSLKTWPVVYDMADGSPQIPAQTKVYGQPLTLSDISPTRRQYSFMGWSTSPLGTEPEYQPGDEYTDDAKLTLYAIWRLDWSMTLKNADIVRQNEFAKDDDTGERAYATIQLILEGFDETMASVEVHNLDGNKVADMTFVNEDNIDQTEFTKPAGETRAQSFKWYSKTDDVIFLPDQQYTLKLVANLHHERFSFMTTNVYLTVPEEYQALRIDPGESITLEFDVDDEKLSKLKSDVKASWPLGISSGPIDSALARIESYSYADNVLTVTFKARDDIQGYLYKSLIIGEMDVPFGTYWDVTETQSVAVTLLKGEFILDFHKSGKGMGIGDVAPETGLTVGWDTEFKKPVTLDGTLNVKATTELADLRVGSSMNIRTGGWSDADPSSQVLKNPVWFSGKNYDDANHAGFIRTRQESNGTIGIGLFLKHITNSNTYFNGFEMAIDAAGNRSYNWNDQAAARSSLGLGYLDGSGNVSSTLTISGDKQLKREGVGSSWIGGRDHALVRTTTCTNSGSFWPIASVKTQTGSWDIGNIGNTLYFSFAKDSDYNAANNVTETLALYPQNSGGIATMQKANNYWGMSTPEGDHNGWIRTTLSGLIPYAADGTNGASSLGTSSWPFTHLYVKYINGSAITTYIRNQVGGYIVTGWRSVTITSGNLSAGALSGTLSGSATFPSGTSEYNVWVRSFAQCDGVNSVSVSGTTTGTCQVTCALRRAYGAGSGTVTVVLTVIGLRYLG